MPAPERVWEHPPLTDEQRDAFRSVASECHRRMLSETRARAYLAGRGIDMDAIELWNLGYNPGPPEHTNPVAGMRVACGITIPLYGVDGLLYGVSVRRPVFAKGIDKYRQVIGSRVPLYGQPGISHAALLIVEGWFDAILAQALLGDLVDVVALGSSKASVDAQWFERLSRYCHWLVCMDNDDPGQEAAARWNWSKRITKIGAPVGKDITESWQACADLHGWMAGILDGLATPQVAAPTPQVATPQVARPILGSPVAQTVADGLRYFQTRNDSDF